MNRFQRSNPVFVRAINYSVGKSVPITEIGELSGSNDLLDRLSKRGIEVASIIDDDRDSLSDTLNRCFSETNCEQSEITDVIFTTGSSSWSAHDEDTIRRTIQNSGVENTSFLSVNGNQCANVSSALKIARMMALEPEKKDILVLSHDAVSLGEQRLVPPDSTVNGDGSASCIISNSDGDLELLTSSVYSSASLFRLQGNRASCSSARYLSAHLDAINNVVNQVCDELKLSFSDFTKIIPPNLSLESSSLIENIYDLESSMLYSENISRLGHVQSCDPLINLADYCASTTQKCGEYILLLCSGLYSWGATVLRRT